MKETNSWISIVIGLILFYLFWPIIGWFIFIILLLIGLFILRLRFSIRKATQYTDSTNYQEKTEDYESKVSGDVIDVEYKESEIKEEKQD